MNQFLFSSAVLIWVIFLIVLIRLPSVLLFFLLGTVGLLSFYYLKRIYDVSHSGFLFILFFGVLWIYRYSKETMITSIDRFFRFFDGVLDKAVTIILIFHLIGGAIAITMDYRYVFSYGKEVASFIREREFQNKLIIAESDAAASSVLGYLRKEQFYFPRGDRFGSFVRWDIARVDKPTDDLIINKAHELGGRYGMELLFIMNRPLNQDQRSNKSLTQVATFTGSIVKNEGYYLYLLQGDR
jgi:hypothetical protein